MLDAAGVVDADNGIGQKWAEKRERQAEQAPAAAPSVLNKRVDGRREPPYEEHSTSGQRPPSGVWSKNWN